MVFKDKQEAVEYAAVNGYTERDDGALDRVFDTPAFQRGLFSADLIRRINMAELSFEQANAELARYDETQKVLASVASMGAQAFVGGQGRVMVILADRIKAGDEAAVFLHEVTHKWGREVMAAGDWQQLVGRVRSWANRPRQSVERQIHDRAQVRVSTARVASSLHDEEFFAYAVEEAVKLGVKPSAAALVDSAEAWLQQVVDTLERTLLAATESSQVGRLGVSSFPENLQQLVDLAYAMAQLESPARASEIWQRLSDDQQEQLNRILQSQGLSRISEELDTFGVGQGFFTPGRSVVRGMTRDLDGAKASDWLIRLKKDGARAGVAQTDQAQ
ncbi:MAG: hypothetical protein K2W33_00715, partial [Burkholderiales bacterium]|nr:hypothetical protein [Burkholderiales bacterium]